jgi:predicted methyltransferase
MNRHSMLAAMAGAILAIGMDSVTAADADGNIYAEAVAAETRLPGDYERDAGRKPALVLEFFGIERGDTVLDLFSGGGYYTELLSRVVGPEGKVLAHSNQAYLSFVGDEFEARYAKDRLPNVDVVIAENNELDLEPGSLDAIVLVRADHDVYFVADATTDDHTTLVFDPAIRGETDRFVLRFRKPAGTTTGTAG